ncbi:MAG: methyltransferase domain-containing protein [Acidobacteria bacterium]|nr:methyltransferase domain-containing protein [Acidobacteriota bacterium]
MDRVQTSLILSHEGEPLPFAEDSFDAACLCSVLFLLDDPGPLVDEALRVLKPDNELVVLTPTGVGDPSAAVATLPTGSNGRLRNAMVHVW